MIGAPAQYAAMPGRPARKAPTSAPGAMSGARLVFTSNEVGFIRARSFADTSPNVASTNRTCRERTSHSSKKASERVEILSAVVPDGHIVARELLKTGKRAQRVVIVVEDRDSR